MTIEGNKQKETSTGREDKERCGTRRRGRLRVAPAGEAGQGFAEDQEQSAGPVNHISDLSVLNLNEDYLLDPDQRRDCF